VQRAAFRASVAITPTNADFTERTLSALIDAIEWLLWVARALNTHAHPPTYRHGANGRLQRDMT